MPIYGTVCGRWWNRGTTVTADEDNNGKIWHWNLMTVVNGGWCNSNKIIDNGNYGNGWGWLWKNKSVVAIYGGGEWWWWYHREELERERPSYSYKARNNHIDQPKSTVLKLSIGVVCTCYGGSAVSQGWQLFCHCAFLYCCHGHSKCWWESMFVEKY